MKMEQRPRELKINGRGYAWPSRPAVVVCIDGCQPDYLPLAIDRGRMPYLGQLAAQGLMRSALAVLPSYTNPNNISLVSGVSPAIHGICGNYFYDTERDAEWMLSIC